MPEATDDSEIELALDSTEQVTSNSPSNGVSNHTEDDASLHGYMESESSKPKIEQAVEMSMETP